MEKEILEKIDQLNDDNEFQEIIDLVDNLPKEEQTAELISEKGRAYNNLFWFYEDEKYLDKAVETLKSVEKELGNDPSWNYRIGYSYYFLNDAEKAKKHFDFGEYVPEEFLTLIDFALENEISLKEVKLGGKGGVEYPLLMFLDTLKEKASPMIDLLAKGATDEEINDFEKKIGIELPEDFKQLYRTFNGQTQKQPFFSGGMRFLSLDEILETQAEWLKFLDKHFGEDCKNIPLAENQIYYEGAKPLYYNPKWIPILACDTDIICMDLDPNLEVNEDEEQGTYGQLIIVNLNEEQENYSVCLYDSHSTHSYESPLAEYFATLQESLYKATLQYDEEGNFLFYPDYGDFPIYYSQDEITSLENYIEEHFGKIDNVFHELVSPDIHCDIYVINPIPERNYYTLITGGMGAHTMNVPDDFDTYTNIELIINLPPDWDIKGQSDEAHWPIYWLKNLARLPINQNTFLGWGHTIPTSEPIPGTDFNGFILISADDKTGENEAVAHLPTEKQVAFYTIAPIYEEEMLYKLENGAGELFEEFQEAGIPYPPVVNIKRPNVCLTFKPMQDSSVLDDIYWKFNEEYHSGLMAFWQSVKEYNQKIGNDLEDFNPFALLYEVPKVAIIYKAGVKSLKDLNEYEQLTDPESFSSNLKEIQEVNIIAEFSSSDGRTFRALEMLWLIHNTLCNKHLKDNSFNGLSEMGTKDDGTKVFFLELKS